MIFDGGGGGVVVISLHDEAIAAATTPSAGLLWARVEHCARGLLEKLCNSNASPGGNLHIALSTNLSGHGLALLRRDGAMALISEPLNRIRVLPQVNL